MTETKRVLLATLPEKGHLNPMIGVAQHLRRLEVELSFYAPADCSAQLEAAGLDVDIHAPLSTSFQWPEEHCTRGADFAARSKDPAWLRRWIQRLLLDTVESEVDGLRALMREDAPDLVALDPMYYAAIIAAQCEGLPWAGISSSLNPVTPENWQCPMVETIGALGKQRRELFERFGSCPEFKICDAISPWLNIAFTTEDYAPASLRGESPSFLVGSTRPLGPRGDESDMDWQRLDEKLPLIYMSLGSQNFAHESVFAAVVRALEGALEANELQLVLALHDLVDSELVDALPANVLALRYAPQLALLERASLVISHGGANTVMETLHQGIPLLLLPMVNDQHLQARFLEQSGAGLTLDPATMSPADCQRAIESLLAPQNPYARRAADIGRSYRERDGARHAAQLLLELVTRKEPMHPHQPRS